MCLTYPCPTVIADTPAYLREKPHFTAYFLGKSGFRFFPPFQKVPTMPTKLSPTEREVVIAKTAADSEWCVYVTDSAELPYYLSLSEKVGGGVVEHQGGKKIFVPLDSVLLQARRRLNLTTQQRQERATQMKARRVAQSATPLPSPSR
jgi:hypothetical protein